MEKSKEPIKSKKYKYAIGRRKNATATVRLFEGKGESEINSKPVKAVFPTYSHQVEFEKPFKVIDTDKTFHFTAKCYGGGKSAQAGAVRLAISRALVLFDNQYKSALKKAHLISVDSREIERKKPGFRKARKKEQFSKR